VAGIDQTALSTLCLCQPWQASCEGRLSSPAPALVCHKRIIDASANDPRGIGQYTAYAFAGYGVRQIAICDIRPEGLDQTSIELKKRHPDIEVLSINMDARKEQDVESAVAQTVDKFGRLDLGVNNAGIGGEAPTDQLKFENWRKVMSVNLDGVWLCQRAQIRQMLKQELLDPAPRGTRGVIINVSSMLGLVASSPGTPAVAYTASKHAVMGLTKTDAAMYAPRGIRVNAICPGYVATPLLKAATVSRAVVYPYSSC